MRSRLRLRVERLITGRPLMFAAVGTAFWLGYPVAFQAGIHARWEARCGTRIFTGAFDDCFNDYMPIAEVLWSAIVLLAAPGFAWLAVRIWRQLAQPRTASGSLPVMVACGIGLAWTIWNIASTPPRIDNAILFAYWAIFAFWFAVPLVAIRYRKRQSD